MLVKGAHVFMCFLLFVSVFFPGLSRACLSSSHPPSSSGVLFSVLKAVCTYTRVHTRTHTVWTSLKHVIHAFTSYCFPFDLMECPVDVLGGHVPGCVVGVEDVLKVRPDIPKFPWREEGPCKVGAWTLGKGTSVCARAPQIVPSSPVTMLAP